MYPKPFSCWSQNFRNWSSFFSSSSLTSNPSKIPTDSGSKITPSPSTFLYLYYHPRLLLVSVFQVFPMPVPPDDLFSTPNHELLGTQSRTSHFTSENPPLFSHYRWGEKTHITYNGSWGHPGLCLLFWLHVSTDYIIYLAWDTGLLSHVKLIVTFALVISSAGKFFLLLLSSFRSQLKYHCFVKAFLSCSSEVTSRLSRTFLYVNYLNSPYQ